MRYQDQMMKYLILLDLDWRSMVFYQNELGWDSIRITKDIEAVILGMHARIDNPELLKAKELGLKIFSYQNTSTSNQKKKRE